MRLTGVHSGELVFLVYGPLRDDGSYNIPPLCFLGASSQNGVTLFVRLFPTPSPLDKMACVLALGALFACRRSCSHDTMVRQPAFLPA